MIQNDFNITALYVSTQTMSCKWNFKIPPKPTSWLLHCCAYYIFFSYGYMVSFFKSFTKRKVIR